MNFITKFFTLIAWIISIFFGIGVLAGLVNGDTGFAFAFAIIAVLVSPPVLKKTIRVARTNRWVKSTAIVLACFFGLIIGTAVFGHLFMSVTQEKVALEREADRKTRKEAYLPIKDEILAQVETAIKEKDFEKATEIAGPYIGLEDEKLEGLYAEANAHVQEKKHGLVQAAKLIDEVKAYEYFLDNDEATFKTIKPSDADLDTIRKATSTFSALAESLNKARQNKEVLSASDIAYLKGVEKRLSAFQQKILPGLRLGFRKRASELLWQYDTEVSISGTGNKIIGFYAGDFSLNANIKAAQEEMSEILTKLRFTQVRYAWYKDAAGYAYKLETPPDGKLSYFSYGKFQDMAAGY